MIFAWLWKDHRNICCYRLSAAMLPGFSHATVPSVMDGLTFDRADYRILCAADLTEVIFETWSWNPTIFIYIYTLHGYFPDLGLGSRTIGSALYDMMWRVSPWISMALGIVFKSEDFGKLSNWVWRPWNVKPLPITFIDVTVEYCRCGPVFKYK